MLLDCVGEKKGKPESWKDLENVAVPNYKHIITALLKQIKENIMRSLHILSLPPSLF